MKLTQDDMLYVVLNHTDHLEVGELDSSEWAARLIEDQGYTVAGLINYDQTHGNRYSTDDYDTLRALKQNFPQYNI